MNGNLTDKQFEYNLWANTQLIALCATLKQEQLEMEVDGVFGRIQPTIVHLVRAEGGYINRLTGTRPWSEELDWNSMTMDELLEKAQLSGSQLAAMASQTDAAIRYDIERDGNKAHFFNWTVLLQVLYHGIEHRTQIKILLTQLGVEHPELAAWDFTESLDSA